MQESRRFDPWRRAWQPTPVFLPEKQYSGEQCDTDISF